MKRFVILVLLALPMAANADLIYESATLGPEGQQGGNTLSTQYLGTRFELTATTEITAVGGHMYNLSGGDLFAAIVPLAGLSDLPATTDIEAIALAWTVFTTTFPSSDTTVALNAVLGPGFYGLVFGGSGAFGSTGTGAMPSNNTSLPGASYFFRINSGTNWFNAPSNSGWRFFVEGTQASVPEPSTLALLGLGLAGIGFARRGRRVRLS